ncbi:MAG: hypothetical protein AAFR04_16075 [Pseudomonadota bacterium]
MGYGFLGSRTLAIAAVAGFFVSAPLTTAQANLLSDMHAKVRVGGKVCMASHVHTGESGTVASKRAAMTGAARDWSSFTAFEYGRKWASFRASVGKRFSCTKTTGGRPLYSCVVQARACRY